MSVLYVTSIGIRCPNNGAQFSGAHSVHYLTHSHLEVLIKLSGSMVVFIITLELRKILQNI